MIVRTYLEQLQPHIHRYRGSIHISVGPHSQSYRILFVNPMPDKTFGNRYLKFQVLSEEVELLSIHGDEYGGTRIALAAALNDDPLLASVLHQVGDNIISKVEHWWEIVGRTIAAQKCPFLEEFTRYVGKEEFEIELQ
ncbi:MAG: hypothetical protein PHY34_00720 [Patescibacteria group bacterium]|nr:hypothetical protein [Patescibacteria group bacterium]MDD5715848.1 hypothetical protein [Patescibacteria group bacterium]